MMYLKLFLFLFKKNTRRIVKKVKKVQNLQPIPLTMMMCRNGETGSILITYSKMIFQFFMVDHVIVTKEQTSAMVQPIDLE